jgi:acyl-CoA synthetase (AMP-forming)/AMP-acid ligase II
LVGEAAAITRFRSRDAYAMWARAAPIPVWFANNTRFRLNRGGNRQTNAALHRIAITQIRIHPDATRSSPDDSPTGPPNENSPIDEVGELVIAKPMPAMPLYLWNDPDGERYTSSYFYTYPGVWRHRDWMRITPPGSAVILGRSDSAINRRGIRIGTSELYSAIEELPGIADSVCVDVGEDATRSRLVLLIVPAEGAEFDAADVMLRSH